MGVYSAFGLVGIVTAVSFSALFLPLLVRSVDDPPVRVRLLLGAHLCIGAFLIVGPVGSYHINGRAWYDYGLSGWHPPPYHFSDGEVGKGDYDPKFTRPFIWPTIGPMLEWMCGASLFVLILPPLAPVLAVLTLASVNGSGISANGRNRGRLLWAIGAAPQVYLLAWGFNVLAWLAD
jgi:hypothetical protein